MEDNKVNEGDEEINQAIGRAEERAWEFFKLHANQRVVLFRYYITLIVALSAGYVFLLQDYRVLYMAGAVFASALVIYLSCKFLHLDERNIQLINYSKKAILQFEKECCDKIGIDNRFIFTIEQSHKQNNEIKNSHARIFRLIFTLGFIIGCIMFFCGAFKICVTYDVWSKQPMGYAGSLQSHGE